MKNLIPLLSFLKSARRNGTTRLLKDINKTHNCLVLVSTDKEKKGFTNAISMSDIEHYYGVAGPKDKPLPLLIEKGLFVDILVKLINDISDKDYLLNKWIKEADLRAKERNKSDDRLSEGREYLMTVNPNNLIVEDCFEAFGFTRDGFIKFE